MLSCHVGLNRFPRINIMILSLKFYDRRAIMLENDNERKTKKFLYG